MAKSSRFYYNTRYILPIMIGVIVGFAFSLFCTPFFYCDNTLASFRFFNINSSSLLFLSMSSSSSSSSKEFDEQQKQFRLNMIEQQQKQIDEFEPRINLEGKPKKPQKVAQKLIRPRYASVELNIRYKLFVGVISTTRTLTSLATFLNESLSKVSNKATFFVNNAEMNEKLLLESTPPGINVVNFNDDRDHLLPFHSLKYVIDNYINSYDWFFFVTDRTYIRSSRLLDLVNHLSISQDLYMGYVSNPNDSIYCSLSSGIIFSNTLLRKLTSKMEWCIKNSYSENPSDNVGRCVLHSTNMGCTSYANGRNGSFYENSNFDFDTTIDQLIFTPNFNKSISVTKVMDLETMKKLELYFDTVEMDEIEAEIDKTQKSMREIICETPDGCDSLIWPLGVPEPYRPKSRHEVIRWDYFNATHLFLGTDFDTVEEMTDYYKKDVEEVIKFSISNLNNKAGSVQYQFKRLLNGYKQFDPTRGSAYVLDLLLFDSTFNVNVHKRLNLMRPLGHVEIIPMPYVTESQKINLVVTFSVDTDAQNIVRFFSNYEKFVLQVKEIANKMSLYVVYAITNNAMFRDREFKMYVTVGEQIKELTKKYSSLIKTTSQIFEINVQLEKLNQLYSEGYRQVSVLEQISQNVTIDGLILMVSPCAEMKLEFFNRVRLNTIKNKQVFFPIPFSQYMPNIIYPANATDVEEVEINKNYGHFNTYSYEFFSFYNSDYQFTRANYARTLNLTTNKVNMADYVNDAYDLFMTNANLYVLRATDQALKCRWSLNENCYYEKKTQDERERCLKQLETGLGTKAQLAMHLMKNYDKIAKN